MASIPAKAIQFLRKTTVHNEQNATIEDVSLTEEDRSRVQDIVNYHQHVKGLSSSKPSLKRKKSVLPGHGRESYVEKRMREKREEKDQKEINEVLVQALDCKAPINNAKMYIADAIELTNKVMTLSSNEGVQNALGDIDQLANLGDEKAKELSQRINVSILAFQNDMSGSQSMIKDLTGKIDVLEPKISEAVDGATLRMAAELDAVTSAANWSLATMYGMSAQNLLSNLDEAVSYSKEKSDASVTDVNVITDVVVKNEL